MIHYSHLQMAVFLVVVSVPGQLALSINTSGTGTQHDTPIPAGPSGTTCNDDQVNSCRQAALEGKLDLLPGGGGQCLDKPYVHQFSHLCVVENYLPSVDHCCCELERRAILCCRYHQDWNHFRCREADDIIANVTSTQWEILHHPEILYPLVIGSLLTLVCLCYARCWCYRYVNDTEVWCCHCFNDEDAKEAWASRKLKSTSRPVPPSARWGTGQSNCWQWSATSKSKVESRSSSCLQGGYHLAPATSETHTPPSQGVEPSAPPLKYINQQVISTYASDVTTMKSFNDVTQRMMTSTTGLLYPSTKYGYVSGCNNIGGGGEWRGRDGGGPGVWGWGGAWRRVTTHAQNERVPGPVTSTSYQYAVDAGKYITPCCGGSIGAVQPGTSPASATYLLQCAAHGATSLCCNALLPHHCTALHITPSSCPGHLIHSPSKLAYPQSTCKSQFALTPSAAYFAQYPGLCQYQEIPCAAPTHVCLSHYVTSASPCSERLDNGSARSSANITSATVTSLHPPTPESVQCEETTLAGCNYADKTSPTSGLEQDATTVSPPVLPPSSQPFFETVTEKIATSGNTSSEHNNYMAKLATSSVNAIETSATDSHFTLPVTVDPVTH